ncbi:MAG TPA: hypothetical protein VGW77_16950 [Candidatus Binatia bacterium]|jgi:hypothetical protein|nr:hypothetical protein [Candidatus Binatia bacterium]
MTKSKLGHMIHRRKKLFGLAAMGAKVRRVFGVEKDRWLATRVAGVGD